MKRRIIGGILLLIFVGVLLAQASLLVNIPPDRVEVLCMEDREALKAALSLARERSGALVGLDISWEEDRAVLTKVDMFTGRRVEAGLVQAGLGTAAFRVLDYSWAADVLCQSGQAWRGAAAVLLVWCVCRLLLTHGGQEVRRGRQALERQYLSEYLSAEGVCLMGKAVAGVLGVCLVLLLLRWLWRAEIALPTGLLPEDSVFDRAHYRQWWAGAFPQEEISDYGLWLSERLKQSYLLAAVETAALWSFAGTVFCHKKRTKRRALYEQA